MKNTPPIFTSSSLLVVVLKHRWLLIGLTLLALIAGFVFSSPFFIKPKYRSYALIYPSNLTSYSDETETEQILQLFRSEDIAIKCAEEMNLAEHYDISRDSRYFHTKLMGKFHSNVNFRKTEFESVEISVYDTHPDTACKIALKLIDLVNDKALGLIREKLKEVVVIWSDQMVKKEREIDSLKIRIDSVRVKYKIVDFESQLKESSRQYFTMLRERGHASENNELTSFMRNLESKGFELFHINEILNSHVQQYTDIRNNYEKAMTEFNKELTFTNFVATPRPADKKSSPVRWLIVLGSVMGTWLIVIIILVLKEIM